MPYDTVTIMIFRTLVLALTPVHDAQIVKLLNWIVVPLSWDLVKPHTINESSFEEGKGTRNTRRRTTRHKVAIFRLDVEHVVRDVHLNVDVILCPSLCVDTTLGTESTTTRRVVTVEGWSVSPKCFRCAIVAPTLHPTLVVKDNDASLALLAGALVGDTDSLGDYFGRRLQDVHFRIPFSAFETASLIVRP